MDLFFLGFAWKQLFSNWICLDFVGFVSKFFGEMFPEKVLQKWCKTGDSPWFINRDSLFHWRFFCQYMGGFLKCWYPKTMGFPGKNDHFGVFWGYHHLRKHPHTIHLFQCEDLFFGWLLKRDPELTLQGCCM